MHRLAVVVAPLSLLLAACGGGDGDTGGASGSGEAAQEPAVVVAVSDGDTIRVRIAGREERVRLIGIDTPETNGPGGLRECFGAEATARTKALLPKGTEVDLVRDAEARDRYGRLLAYVYRRPDKTFVNMALAREGYAAALTVPPNVAYAEEFREAAAAAREAEKGLWSRCGGADTPLR